MFEYISEYKMVTSKTIRLLDQIKLLLIAID